MNTKTPFTPLEVNMRLAEIRVATTEVVEAEATAVETDFNKWLPDNFALDAQQVAYLNSLGPAFSLDTGNSLAHAFRQRHKVTMEKGNPKLRSIKFIRKDKKEETTSAPDTAPSVENELNFFIS